MFSPAFDVLTATAAELQTSLKAEKLTSVEIISAYLAQVQKHNHTGAKLNAMITVAPRDLVFKAAHKLDKERSEGRLRGPLHGLPLIVKDCFQFGPELGMKTTVGAFCFAQEKAKKTAEVIDQLIDKGMIILGTANLSEFCGNVADNMTPGWSAYGGQTRSAYEQGPPPDRPEAIPDGLEAPTGGSSSGSAVGVSAGFAPLSLGTETGGSVVHPASRAGLYALRPVQSFVSTKGVFRASKSFDGIGGMARTPYDLSLLIKSILTPETRAMLPGNGFEDSLTGSWKGLRVGILPCTWGGESPMIQKKWGTSPIKDVYAGVAQKIQNGGGFVVFPLQIGEAVGSNDGLKHNGLSMREIAHYELNETIQEFCEGFDSPKIQTLSDVVKYNDEHPELAMPDPHRDQKELIEALDSSLSAEEAATAYREINRKAGKDGMDTYMRENKVDVVVANSDCTLVIWASVAGYPSATVPLGIDANGFPYGLFLIARVGREDILFSFMSAFEATFPKAAGAHLD